MPIYEYRCKDCGDKFEKLVRAGTDQAGLICPNCGSQQTEKLFSLFATSSSSTTPTFSSSSQHSCQPTA